MKQSDLPMTHIFFMRKDRAKDTKRKRRVYLYQMMIGNPLSKITKAPTHSLCMIFFVFKLRASTPSHFTPYVPDTILVSGTLKR